MKNKIYLLFLAILGYSIQTFGQTNLTVDGSGNLNLPKLVAATGTGQSFFTGHQSGSGYTFSQGIFRALTDNPTGSSNFFYDGVTNGNTLFYVRADGLGYYAGGLGIGTTTPQSFTEIRKDVNSGQGPVLELTNGGGNTAASSEIYFSTYLRSGTSPSARIKVADDGDWGGNFYFDTKGTSGSAPLNTRLYIDGATGYVGIGITTPNANLAVAGSGLVGNFSNLSDQDVNITLSAVGATDKHALIAPSTSTALAFGTAGAEKMRINSSGNLVIGQSTQTNTSYKLDVYGSARANSIVVNTNGADFVFDPAYKLPALTDVKNYIALNHHLPEIASAKEMQANGLNVGENQTKLLQKIEELTLYLIEKDNKEKQKDAQIEAQKEQLKKQEERLNKIERQLKGFLKE